MRFKPYFDPWQEANVVVDSAPRHGTILTLSHWPGTPTPPDCVADSSAESVCLYAEQHGGAFPASVVTASHFDTDALISLHLVMNPVLPGEAGRFWVEVASAGDFEVAASAPVRRLAYALENFANPRLSPERDAIAGKPLRYRDTHLFQTMLPQLERYREAPGCLEAVWHAHEVAYVKTRAFLAQATTSFVEDGSCDLSVILAGPLPDWAAAQDTQYGGLCPFAIHENCRGLTVALVAGDRCFVVQRYEGWVRLKHDRPRRRDLAPLVGWLRTNGFGDWRYPGVWHVLPVMARAIGEMERLDRDAFVDALRSYLLTAPPAWDPNEVAGRTNDASVERDRHEQGTIANA